MAHDAQQPILDLIDSARAKRASALDRIEKEQRAVERLDVEIEAYHRALTAMRGGDHRTSSKATDTPALSDKWASIYRTLHEASDGPYGYDDIILAAELAGHEVKTPATRTQMMNAVNNEIFVRNGPGKFDFTEKGLAAIGASPKEIEPPEGSSKPDTGEVAASPDPAQAPGYQPRLQAADPLPHSEGETGG